MRVTALNAVAGTYGWAVAIVRLFLATTHGLRHRFTTREWSSLRNKVDHIIAELESSDSPKPTHQMCQLLVVGEDHRFQYHPGVDPIALCRAIWKTVFYGSRQGGSTIAMQLVRTVTGHFEKTSKRKLLEINLAVRLTRHIGRDRLPALYLWVGYYGWRMNNFNQACSRIHLDPLSASDLETAMLIARLKYPEPRTMQRERMRRIQRRAAHLMALRTSKEENLLWNHSAFRIH